MHSHECTLNVKTKSFLTILEHTNSATCKMFLTTLNPTDWFQTSFRYFLVAFVQVLSLHSVYVLRRARVNVVMAEARGVGDELWPYSWVAPTIYQCPRTPVITKYALVTEASTWRRRITLEKKSDFSLICVNRIVTVIKRILLCFKSLTYIWQSAVSRRGGGGGWGDNITCRLTYKYSRLTTAHL